MTMRGFFPHPAFLVNPNTTPQWLPLVGTTAPSLYADFTTEGTTNHYWYSNKTYAGEAAWLTALSGTFTRASSAFYTNSSGVLTSAGNNALRFDYAPVALTAKGLLLEGASTNLRLNSQTIAGAQTTNTNLSVSDNAAAAPDGTMTAASFAPTATNAVHASFNTSSFAATAAPWTNSVYVKPNAGRWFGLSFGSNATVDGAFFDLLNGVTGTVSAGTTATITAVGSGWYRVSITRTLTNGLATYVQLEPHSADNETVTWNSNGSQTFWIWGVQSEALSFASSYIPTTTTTVARAADSLRFPTSQLSSSGPAGVPTFVALVKSPGVLTGSNSTYFSDSGFTKWALLGSAASNQNQLFGSAVISAPLPGGTGATLTKRAFSTKGTGGSSIAANGGTPFTDGTTTLVSLQTNAAIGDTSSIFSGWISAFGAWKDITATGAQLQALTQ